MYGVTCKLGYDEFGVSFFLTVLPWQSVGNFQVIFCSLWYILCPKITLLAGTLKDLKQKGDIEPTILVPTQFQNART